MPADPGAWKCDETGVTDNLWLNLSTGHIGSGREVSHPWSILLHPSSSDHSQASVALRAALCALSSSSGFPLQL